tara:strand:- start:1849 stop:2373 length:525 start_codon:yes stop_codon:yes gene_type:complete
MNNLQKYVNHVQPVVNAIREHNSEFYLLWYYNLSAEDLFAEDGLIEFQTKTKNRPEHFSGAIPMVYAQWGEETGASIVLEISPEQRKLLSPEVIDAIKGEHLEYQEEWVKTPDKTVYLLMDHEYYQTCAGFAPSNEFKDSVDIGWALDFLSHRLGLNYLNIHEARTNLEYILDQ